MSLILMFIIIVFLAVIDGRLVRRTDKLQKRLDEIHSELCVIKYTVNQIEADVIDIDAGNEPNRPMHADPDES